MNKNEVTSEPRDPHDVTVIGGGIVGVCCALHLQRVGHAVTILEPQGPGEGCTSGNGGQLVAGYCVPVGLPGIVRQVPHMLLDPLGPLTIRWRYLPRLLPWLLRFIAASSKRRVESIADALHALSCKPLDALGPLITSAGAEALIVRQGRLDVYATDAGFERARRKYDLLQARGVRVEPVSSDEVGDLEPSLAGRVRCGVLLPETAHVTDPLRMTQLLARDFVKRGGVIAREKVSDFEIGTTGPVAVLTDTGRRDVQRVVVAAGAHSRPLAARLGSRLPLDTERGYHVMLPHPGVEVRRTVVSGDHYFGLTPMAGGLRLAGTVELAGLDAPPNDARADSLVRAARRLLPQLSDRGATRWMGFRPSMPDSLPVIDRSPAHENVLFAFGHGHLGLTMAAMTGQLVAQLMDGRATSIDVSPYRARRFA